jgi:hypothetical protein
MESAVRRGWLGAAALAGTAMSESVGWWQDDPDAASLIAVRPPAWPALM